VDACVNAANTLASWAELEQGDGVAGRAGELLTAAVEGYQRALQQEEDAAVSPSCSGICSERVRSSHPGLGLELLLQQEESS
jgi:hypothetical protein